MRVAIFCLGLISLCLPNWAQSLQLDLAETRDQYYVITLVSGDYRDLLPDGSNNQAAREDLGQFLFGEVPDSYDSLLVFTTFPIFDDTESRSTLILLRNHIEGLGLAMFDAGASFGSPANLRAYLDMGPIDNYNLVNTAFTRRQLLKAIAAPYLGFASYQQGSPISMGARIGQWRDNLGAGRSVAGGFRFEDLGDGSWLAHADDPGYSSLDLYLMGLLPSEAVADFPWLETSDPIEPNQRVAPTQVRTVSIDDIILANGPRIPAAADAPKVFKLAVVFLTDRPLTDNDRDKLNRLLDLLRAEFFTQTRGLGMLDLTTVPQEQVHTAPPGTDAAITWLCSQSENGLWADTAHTTARETALVLTALATETNCIVHNSVLPTLTTATRTSEELAELSAAFTSQGFTPDAAMRRLLDRQNVDGGWGALADDRSSIQDTAAVLRLLWDQLPATVRDQGFAWLMANRDENGSWANDWLLTLEALSALVGRVAEAELSIQVAHLASQQRADGGFGRHGSQILHTARAVSILSREGTYHAAVTAGLNFLRDRQRADGSWSGRVYETATVLALLRRNERANLVLDQLAISETAPFAGSPLSITANLRNTGGQVSTAPVLQLRDGPIENSSILAQKNLADWPVNFADDVTIDWNVDLPPGPQSLLLYVTTPADEFSLADNGIPFDITIQSDAPDLTFAHGSVEVGSIFTGTSFDLADNPIFTGDTARVTALLRNDGRQTASAIQIWVTSDTPDGPTIAGPVAVTDLAGLSNQQVALAFTVNDPPSTRPIYLHCSTTTSELSTTNNTAATSLTIHPPPDTGVVRLRTLSLTPATFTSVPQNFTWHIRADNPGPDDLFGVQIRFEDSNGQPLAPSQTVDIAAGAFTDLTAHFNLGVLDYHTMTATAAVERNFALVDSYALDAVVRGDQQRDIAYVDGSIHSTPQPAAVGALVTVTADFTNHSADGLADIPFALLATDGGISTTLASRRIFLQPGNQSIQFSFTPSTASAGLLLQIMADSDDVLQELDESNNVASETITVASDALANLQLRNEDIGFSPDPPVNGQPLQVTGIVGNTGQTAMGAFDVGLYIGNPQTDGRLITSQSFASLSPGAQQSLNLDWDPFEPAGENFVYLWAHSTDGQMEITTDDNLAFRRLQPINGPDLLVGAADLAIDPTILQPNQALTIHGAIQNRGDLAAPASTLSLVDPDRGITLLSQPVDAMPANSKRTFSLALTNGLDAAVNRIHIIVDRDDDVREFNESNNLTPLDIRFRTGDFFADYDSFSPNGDGVRDWVTLYVDHPAAARIVIRDEKSNPIIALPVTTATLTWTGRNDFAEAVRDGQYGLALEDGSGNVLDHLTVRLDTNRVPLSSGEQPVVEQVLISASDAQPTIIGIHPDKRRIYLKMQGQIWLHDQTTGDRLPLFDAPNPANDVAAMVFSPDERHAILIEWVNGGNRFYYLDLRSGDYRDLNLVAHPTGEVFSASNNPLTAANYIAFDDSGRHLLHYASALSYDSLSYDFTEGFLARLDLETGELVHRGVLYFNMYQVLGRTFAQPEYGGLSRDDAWDMIRFSHQPKFGLFTWRGDLFYGSHNGLLRFPQDAPLTQPFYNFACDDFSLSSDCPNLILTSQLLPSFPCSHLSRYSDRDTCLQNANATLYPQDYGMFFGDPNTGTVYFNAYPENYVDSDANPVGPEGRALWVQGYQLPADEVSPLLRTEPIPDPSKFKIDYRRDPCQGCQSGLSHSIAMTSRGDNLHVQFGVLNDPLSSITLFGSAGDAHLDAIYFEYAFAHDPTTWFELRQPLRESRSGERLAYWVPTQPGEYLIRVTALDTAGNRRTRTQRVRWQPAPLAVTGLNHDHDYISPNGDGRQDAVTVQYRTNLPATIDVAIEDETGEMVRRLEAIHASAGNHQQAWDGRDEHGVVVPDGRYRLRVANQVTIDIVVDTLAPHVTLAWRDLRRPNVSPKGRPICTAQPRPITPARLLLDWQLSATDDNLRDIRLLQRDTRHSAIFKPLVQWQPPQRTHFSADRQQPFQAAMPFWETTLEAQDKAGNIGRSPVSTLPIRQGLWLTQTPYTLCGPWLESSAHRLPLLVEDANLRFNWQAVGDPDDPVQSADVVLLNPARNRFPLSFAVRPEGQGWFVSGLALAALLDFNAVIEARTQSGALLTSEQLSFFPAISVPRDPDDKFKVLFEVDRPAEGDCDGDTTIRAGLWDPANADALAQLEASLSCGDNAPLLPGAVSADPTERLQYYRNFITSLLPFTVDIFVNGTIQHTTTFNHLGQVETFVLDPNATRVDEVTVAMRLRNATSDYLVSRDNGCFSSSQHLLAEAIATPITEPEPTYVQTGSLVAADLQIPALENANLLCADVDYLLHRAGGGRVINQTLTHLASGQTANDGFRHNGNTLLFFGERLAERFADRNDRFQLSISVQEPWGICRTFTWTFRLDLGVQATLTDLFPTFISPNGDGVQDATGLAINYAEPMATNRIEVLTTGDNPATIRSLRPAAPQVVGEYTDTWDGTNDLGNIVPDGTYSVVATVSDLCGAEAQLGGTITVDRTAPIARIDAPVDGAMVGGILTVSGAVSDLNISSYTLSYSRNGTDWVTVADGTTSRSGQFAQFHVGTQAGPAFLALSVKDQAGNESHTSRQLQIMPASLITDITAPQTYFSPNGDTVLDRFSLDVTFGAAVQSTVTVRNSGGATVQTLFSGSAPVGTLNLAWDGSLSTGGLAPDGVYTLHVLAEDGPSSEAGEITAVLDVTAPSVTITAPSDGFATAATQVNVTGSLIETNPEQWSLRLLDAGLNELARRDGSGTTINSMLDVLREGTFYVDLVATDRAGNQGSQRHVLNIDRTAPEVAFTAPAANGFVHGTPTITATVTDASAVHYALEWGYGKQPSVFNPISNGGPSPPGQLNMPWDLSGLGDGTYRLRLTVIDTAGNTNATVLPINVDTTPPLAAIDLPGEGTYVGAPLTVSGTVSDAHFLNYSLALAPGEPAAPGPFSPLVTTNRAVENGPLHTLGFAPADGPYTLRLIARDQAGFETTRMRGFVVDTVPPDAPVLSAIVQDRANVAATWTAATATDVNAYALYRNGVEVARVSDLSFLDQGLANGEHTYTVAAIDRAGNTSPHSNAVILRVDLEPPQITLAQPSQGDRVTGLVRLLGTIDDVALDRYRIQVLDASRSEVARFTGTATVVQSEIWAWPSSPNEGQYTIIIDAWDAVQNQARTEIDVLVDNTPPNAPVLVTATVVGNRVDLSWNANNEADLAGYVPLRNGQPVNGADLSTTGVPLVVTGTSFSDENVPDGNHTYHLLAFDQTGQASPLSNGLQAVVDTRPPHIDITSPAPASRHETDVLIAGNSEDEDIDTVDVAMRPAAGGAWTSLATLTQAPYGFRWDLSAVAQGSYEVRMTATDQAGQIDPAPESVFFVHGDATPPPAPQDLVVTYQGRAVQITWSPVVTKAGKTDLAGYRVQRNGADVSPLLATTVFNLPFELDGDYRYTVTAEDVAGNRSAPSNADEAHIYATVLNPYPVITTGGSASFSGTAHETATRVVLSDLFTATELHAAPVQNGSFRFDLTGLANDRITYRLHAEDIDGNQSLLNSAFIANGEQPQIANLTVTPVDPQVQLNWDAVFGAVGYLVERNGTNLTPAIPVTINGIFGSSEGSSFNSSCCGAAKAMDGNSFTRWEPRGSDLYPSLDLYFDRTYPLQELAIEWEYDQQATQVQAFFAGQWRTVELIPFQAGTYDTFLRFTHAVPTDRLRLLIDTTVDSFAFGGIREVSLTAFGAHGSVSFTDSPNANATHSYRVRAIDRDGRIGPAAQVSVALGDQTPPAAPTNLVATVSGRNDVQLNWMAVTDAAQYGIYLNGSFIANSPTPSFLHLGRPNGTYTYQVTAYDAVGNESQPSAPAEITVTGPVNVAAPHDLTLAINGTDTGFVLNWQGDTSQAEFSHFAVLRERAGVATIVGTTSGLRFEDTTLYRGVRYVYRIAAVDIFGNLSAPSNAAAGELIGQPPEFLFPGQGGDTHTTQADRVTITGVTDPAYSVDLYRDSGYAATTHANDQWRLQHQLDTTGLASFYLFPQMSRDGRYLITAHQVETDRHRFEVYDVELGGMVDQVGGFTDATKWAGPAALAPDPTWAALQVWNEDGNNTYRTFVWNREQGTVTLLDSLTAFGVHWLDDGRLIYASLHFDASGDPRSRLIAYNPLTEVSTVLTEFGFTLELLPVFNTDHIFLTDGRRVVYRQDGKVGSPLVTVWAGNVSELVMHDPDNLYTLTRERVNGVWFTKVHRIHLPNGSETEIYNEEGYSQRLQVMPDSRFILFASNNTLRAIDTLSGEEVNLTVPDRIYDYALSPTGRVALDDGSLSVFEMPGAFRFEDVALAFGPQAFTTTSAAPLETIRFSDPLTIVREAPPQANLRITAADLRIFPAAPLPGEATTLLITVHNDGTAGSGPVNLTGLLDDGISQTPIQASVPALAPGQATTINIPWTAFVQPGEVLWEVSVASTDGESHLNDNSANRTLIIFAEPSLNLQAALNTATVGADGDITLDVQVGNGGNDRDVDMIVELADSNGRALSLLDQRAYRPLAFGAVRQYTVPWNVGNTPAGSYVVNVTATNPANGQMINAVMVPLQIEADHALASTVLAAKPRFGHGETVRLVLRIANQSRNLTYTDLQATLIFSQGGTVIDQIVLPVPTLDTGQNVELGASWQPANAPLGHYTAELILGDAGGNHATSQASFERYLDPIYDLFTDWLNVPSDIDRGQTFAVELTLTNTGNVDLLAQEVAFFLDGNGVTMMPLDVQTVNLNPGATTPLTVAVDTANLDYGSYTLSMQATFPDNSQSNDLTTLTIRDGNAPRIAITGVTANQRTNNLVTPIITVTDDNLASTSTTLNGAPFLSGTVVGSDGVHTLRVIATDTQSNQAERALSFSIDKTLPAIDIDGVVDGATYGEGRTPIIRATDTNPTETNIRLNGVPYTSGTPITQEGRYQLQVDALDNHGNLASTGLSFDIVLTPPIVTIGGIDTFYNNHPIAPEIDMRGTAIASRTVLLNQEPLQESTAITQEGSYLLFAAATNPAGTTEDQREFVIDLTPPSIVVNGLPAGTGPAPVTPQIDITDQYLSQQQSILLNGSTYTPGTPITSTGDYQLEITAWDLAGNRTEANFAFSLTDPTITIAITGVDNGGIYTDPVTPVIDVQGDDPNLRTITLNGQPFTSGTAVSAVGDYLLLVNAANATDQVTRSLSFKIAAPSRRLAVSPPAIDFGPIPLGEQRQASIALTSTGSLDVTLNEISLNFASVAAFVLTPPGTLVFPPTATGFIEIQFEPNQLGDATAMVEITSNANNLPQAWVPICARGVIVQDYAAYTGSQPGGIDGFWRGFGPNRLLIAQGWQTIAFNGGTPETLVQLQANQRPTAVVENAAGHLYFLTDTEAGLIIQHEDGRQRLYCERGFRAMTYDENRDLPILVDEASNLYRLTPADALEPLFVHNGEFNFHGLDFDRASDQYLLYDKTGQQIIAITPDGTAFHVADFAHTPLALAFTEDGNRVEAVLPDGIYRFSTTWHLIYPAPADNPIQSSAYDADNQRWLVQFAETAAVVAIQPVTGQQEVVFRDSANELLDADLLPGGELVLLSRDHLAHKGRNGALLQSVPVAIPSGHAAVTTGTNGYYILDEDGSFSRLSKQGDLTSLWQGPAGGAVDIALFADDRLALLLGQTIYIWDGTSVQPLDVTLHNPYALAVMPDGNLAVSTGTTIHVIDTHSATQLSTLTMPSTVMSFLAWPDGSWWTSDGTHVYRHDHTGAVQHRIYPAPTRRGRLIGTRDTLQAPYFLDEISGTVFALARPNVIRPLWYWSDEAILDRNQNGKVDIIDLLWGRDAARFGGEGGTP